jgi:hypothetical protein
MVRTVSELFSGRLTNTVFSLLTLEGGGWEGVSGHGVLDSVFLWPLFLNSKLSTPLTIKKIKFRVIPL